MKKLMAITTLLLAIFTTATNACDEQCMRDKAEATNKTTFPSYLTWQYCEDTRMDFITNSMESIQRYSSENFDVRYRGGMRTIKHYLEQRKAWLQECDGYMRMTGQTPIFFDNKTTRQIFAKIDSVTKELELLLSGVTYSGDTGEITTAVATDKFNGLIKAVDDHKNLMLLKGRYVIR